MIRKDIANIQTDGYIGSKVFEEFDNILKDYDISHMASLIISVKGTHGCCEVDVLSSLRNIRTFVEKRENVLKCQREKLLSWINTVYLCKIQSDDWWYEARTFIKKVCVLVMILERLYNETPKRAVNSENGHGANISNMPPSIMWIYDQLHAREKTWAKIQDKHEKLCEIYYDELVCYYVEKDIETHGWETSKPPPKKLCLEEKKSLGNEQR